MRRPTIEQLRLVRYVAGNGWGDGDCVEWMDATEKRKHIRAMQAFDNWIEHLQGAKFNCPLVAALRKPLSVAHDGPMTEITNAG